MPAATLEDKERLEEEFLAFLHESNFPGDSIYRGPCFRLREPWEWKHSLREKLGGLLGAETADQSFPHYADLALLDLENREYVALIEFRLRLNEDVEAELAQFFRLVLDALETKPPIFLVVPLLNTGFRIYQLRENNHWQELPRKNFPHYATLVAGHAAEKAVAHEARAGTALYRFTATCYVLAGAIALVTTASIGGLATLSTGQMLLMALVALLVVAPHTVGFRLSHARTRDQPRLLRAR